MTGAVSWEALVFVTGLLVSSGGLVAAIVIRLSSRLADIRREHDDFRVEVAKTYATLAALDKVQATVAEEMRGLRSDFSKGFDRVVEVMKTIVLPSASPTRRK